jgi:arylsulfatase B
LKKLLLIIAILFCQNINAQRNVILVVADDLGSDWCGFYDNHIDTCKMPNVRKLLARGVRFSNAWSNPFCSPTRAGVFTGRYSFRTGVGDAIGGAGSAVLDTGEVTIPRLLNIYKPNGIAKANIGKWHLQTASPSHYFYPNLMGYDKYEGFFNGMLSDYFNWTKVTNGVAANCTNYVSTENVNNAITWLKTVPSNKPFFLWLAFNAPHMPYHLPPANLHSYGSLSGTAADITANPKLYFKAMVEAMDTEIGRLFDSLDARNLTDSTDIIFMGDNGDASEVAQITGGAKGSVYQQGVMVPFIIAGPSVINKNRVSDALVNTQDLFATILELFGYTNWQTQIPTNKPVDSKSILPIIKNTATSIRPWTFTEVFKIPTVASDGKAMRNMDFKLIDFDNGTQKFYNLANDPNEKTNLLLGSLTSIEQTNYNYLCNEMSTLIGTGGFCVVTALNDLQENKLEVFPNPFIDFIKIKNTNETVIFTNSIGSILYKGNKINEQNFASLASGIYFLKVKNATYKIVKN